MAAPKRATAAQKRAERRHLVHIYNLFIMIAYDTVTCHMMWCVLNVWSKLPNEEN